MRNRAKCFGCGAVIESVDRHDFVRCHCGALAVDGGQDYFKRSFNPEVEWCNILDNGTEVSVES